MISEPRSREKLKGKGNKKGLGKEEREKAQWKADKERVVVVVVVAVPTFKGVGHAARGGRGREREGCMSVVARTIDEKRCEEWLGFSESLSSRGTLQNEGRQVHRGCSWEAAACTIVVARHSDVLSSSLLAPPRPLHPSPHLDPYLRGGKTKRQISGKNIVSLFFLRIESINFLFGNFALVDFQKHFAI